MPATAMAPTVTQAEHQPSTIAPSPSATPDPGPKETNLASSPQNGRIWQTTSSPQSQIDTDEDPEQKADPSVSPINNADENSGQYSYPEQPAQGNTDTGSGQGEHLNPNSSKDNGDNTGQVGQQQSNDGQVDDPKSLRVPENTPDQHGNVISIGSQTPGQAATVNSQMIQLLRDAISIAGTTLSAGASPITISGTPIALDSGTLVVGSSSVRLAQPPLSLIPGQVTNLNGVVIKQLPSGISVSGSTLTPGAPPINGEVVQPLFSWVSVAGTPLTPGGPAIKTSGTQMSLGSDVLMIGTNSILFATDDPTPVVTTIAGQMITVNQSAVEIGSSTLTPGGPGLILSGTIVSLNYAGQLVVGSKTITPQSKSSGGLNTSGSIGSGNVVNPENDTGKGVQAFQGSANALKSRSAGIILLWLLCACLIRS